MFRCRCLVIVLLLAAPLPAIACPAADENAAFAVLKQLVGRWHVTVNGAPEGEFTLAPGAGGCSLLERWQSADGSSATGLHWTERTADDAGEQTTVLRQVYVDDSGWFIHAEGRIENGALIYEGHALLDDKPVLLRVTMHGLGSEEIVHINDVSTDDGATWRRMSTYRYRRIE